VGIPSESIENLFKVKSTFSTTGTSNEKGTGLGLIICKEFILTNGGDLWVESEQGKGSKFIFTLPSA
jgi:signal transduction histidine kinase